MEIGTKESEMDVNKRLLKRHVDPELIKLFPLRDRTEAWNDPAKYKDLIESLQKEGDQINPTIVRKTDDPEKPYELIVGGRRLNACKHNGIRLLVQVKSLTDREAAKMVNEENSNREDSTAFEKALHAFNMWNSGLYEEQEALSIDLNIPKQTLSDRLTSAKISNHRFLYDLLTPHLEINVKKSIKVAQALGKQDTFKKVKEYIQKNFNQDSTLIGQPNKILDDVISFVESLGKKTTGTAGIVLETIKIDGSKAVIKRNRKGKITIKLEAFPEDSSDYFKRLEAEARKLLK